MTEPLSFSARLALAWSTFFRILRDASWALTVRELTLQPQLGEGSAPHNRTAGHTGSRNEAPAAATTETKAAPATDEPKPAPTIPDSNSALLLLSLLQRNGRFLDFTQQDIAPFSDVEVGQVARVVHAGCQKTLAEHFKLTPVRTEAEGARITVSDASEARRVKLTGNVAGAPPYHGVLRHRGWKTESVELPQLLAGADAKILAPAEVEL
ncbi:MAG: DUF2760 domain-containing protein [Polyangiaceae bacterium]|nr:DUF2760 domain-containing protein [Polyangiaceae bacterium]